MSQPQQGGSPRDQMIQMLNLARRAQGASGLGIGGGGEDSSSVPVLAGGTRQDSRNRGRAASIRAGSLSGDGGSVESGSLSISTQQSAPFGFPSCAPQSSQHLSFSLSGTPQAEKPGRSTLLSNKHSRAGNTCVGIIVPKQISRKAESTRCIATKYFACKRESSCIATAVFDAMIGRYESAARRRRPLPRDSTLTHPTSAIRSRAAGHRRRRAIRGCRLGGRDRG